MKTTLKAKPLEAVRAGIPTKEAAAEDRVRVNLDVPKSFRRALKELAAKRETTVTDLIVDAVKATYMKAGK